jgi:hypothetical protein
MKCRELTNADHPFLMLIFRDSLNLFDSALRLPDRGNSFRGPVDSKPNPKWGSGEKDVPPFHSFNVMLKGSGKEKSIIFAQTTI